MRRNLLVTLCFFLFALDENFVLSSSVISVDLNWHFTTAKELESKSSLLLQSFRQYFNSSNASVEVFEINCNSSELFIPNTYNLVVHLKSNGTLSHSTNSTNKNSMLYKLQNGVAFSEIKVFNFSSQSNASAFDNSSVHYLSNKQNISITQWLNATMGISTPSYIVLNKIDMVQNGTNAYPTPTGKYISCTIQMQNMLSSSLSRINILRMKKSIDLMLKDIAVSPKVQIAGPLLDLSIFLKESQAIFYISVNDSITDNIRSKMRNFLIFGNPASLKNGQTVVLGDILDQLGWNNALHFLHSVSVDTHPGSQKPVSIYPVQVDGNLFRPSNIFYFNKSNLANSGAEYKKCPFMFCTNLAWNIPLNSFYYLESIESKWKIKATAFSISNGGQTPVISAGNSTVWSMFAQSGDPKTLDFILTLREKSSTFNVSNSSAVIIEVKTQFLSSVSSSAIVTSVSTGGSERFVQFDSVLINNNELSVFLNITNELPTTDDFLISGECSACRRKRSLCHRTTGCSTFAKCVSNGLTANLERNLVENGNPGDQIEVTQNFSTCYSTNIKSTGLSDWVFYSDVIDCYVKHRCPLYINSTSSKGVIFKHAPGKQKISASVLSNLPIKIHLQNSTSFNRAVKLNSSNPCTVELTANTTGHEMGNYIAQKCFARSKGSVQVEKYISPTSSTAQVSTTNFEISYHSQISTPNLPALSIFSKPAGVVVEFQNVTFSKLFMQVINYTSSSLGMKLPTQHKDKCTECRDIVLNDCVLNPRCLAMKNCITGSSVYPRVMGLFKSGKMKDRTSVKDAVAACHDSKSVNSYPWRTLQKASSCFSENNCSLTKNDSSFGTKIKWHIETKKQIIWYHNYTRNSTLTVLSNFDNQLRSITIPSMATSFEMENALRNVLKFETLTVTRQEVPNSMLSWMIHYNKWSGVLPSLTVKDVMGKSLKVDHEPMGDIYFEVVGYKSFYNPVVNGTSANSTAANTTTT